MPNAPTNDFLLTVKPAFDFLVSDLGLALVEAEAGESSGNGVLHYRGRHLWLRIIRDRGDIFVNLGGHHAIGETDSHVLIAVLNGATSIRETWPPEPPTIAAAQRFLRAHLGRLEELFAPGNAEQTMSLARRFASERADLMFGDTLA